MRSWQLQLSVDEEDDVPVFLRIARAVAEDIRRGRLRPGAALPGSRSLAASLGVHRNTVIAAYQELAAQGWIETARAHKTFVSASMPEVSPRRFAKRASPRASMPARLGFDLASRAPASIDPADAPSSALVFSSGAPDLRLLPSTVISRAYRRVLSSTAGRRLLDYGDPRGDLRLREAIAAMVGAVRGLGASADTVFVTRGSQMAIDLVARALLSPGCVVAVEALGYRPAWEALAATGARLVSLPLDEHGLSIDALAALCERESVRAVYLTPHHQYPSTVLLAPARRLALCELARACRFAILEDDYDHEFHYDGRPVLPLASADSAGVVIYLGTLSKILAPGLRIGFVVAPAPLIERLVLLRTLVDRQGDLAMERTIADLLEEGEVQRHARRMRRAYAVRRDLLVELLGKHLGEALSFVVPPGGMALWARVAPDIDADAWAERAPRQGVLVSSGRRYAFDGRSRPFFRLGFASLNEGELGEATRRLAAAL